MTRPPGRRRRVSGIVVAAALASCLGVGSAPSAGAGRVAAPESAPAVPPQFERAWGVPVAGPGELDTAAGVARGGSTLYVADSGRDKVIRYSLAGTYYSEFGSSGSGDGQFAGPEGVATDAAGNVYVVDSGNDRVEKFNAAGTFLDTWGTNGAGNGQFDLPDGIAVDSAGNVYVADTGNDRIQKFTSTGTFVRTWGAFGTANRRFDGPAGLAVDSARNVYVTDSGNDRVQVFDTDGTWIRSWGSSGDGTRQFLTPAGITVDGAGNAYVVDSGNDRIQKYAADGSLTTTWGTTGAGNGQFDLADGIALDASGNLYVADTGNRRIQKFNASTTAYVAKWGTVVGPGEFTELGGVAVGPTGVVYVADSREDRVQRFSGSGTYLSAWGGSGTADGRLSTPVGIAVDTGGNVYVADSGNSRVQKFTASGVFLAAWGTEGPGNGQFMGLAGIAVDGAGNVYVTDTGEDPDTGQTTDRVQKFTGTGTFVRAWGSTGTPNGSFVYPAGIATDGAGNVYVVDTGNSRVQRFNANGVFQAKWGAAGSGNGQFQNPAGIAVDGAGNVYVTDAAADPATDTDRVQQFTTAGAFVASWGSTGTGNGQFSLPDAIAVDGARNVYVGDDGNARVQKFNPATGVGGTVTEPSGTPLPGVWVAVLRAADFSVAGGGVTNLAGRFTSLVPAGSYHLYVIDPTARHTTGFFGAPATVAVPAGTVVGADPSIAPTRGTVAGTITDSSTANPVPGSWVIAMDGSTGAPEVGTVADASGRYTLAGLRPGTHFLVQADRAGGHAAAYYPHAADFGNATPVAVTAGATTTADGSMPSQGVLPTASTLSGTVTEAGTGTALDGIFVIVLGASNYRFNRSGVTDSAGRYSISEPSGSYVLAFLDPTGRHRMEWNANHPSSDLALADPVTAPATTNAALDATTGSMTGTVTADPSGAAMADTWVLAIGPTGVAGGAVTTGTGRYTIAGLSPGTYRAAVIDPTGNHAVVYWNRRTSYAAGDPFTVTAGAATTVDAGVP